LLGFAVLFWSAAEAGEPSRAPKPPSAFAYPRTHERLTAYDESGTLPDAIQTYRQELTLTFRSEQAAKQAVVELTPLYDDYAWATSSRWDDNNRADVRMRDVLENHGYHGTFYLNGVANRDVDFSATGRGILRGGNSIGAHGLTHPVLSYVNCNRLFEEVARDRVEWEAAADTPVTCYAFAYCNFRNSVTGNAGQANVNRALRRAGFYLSAERQYNDNLFTDMVGLLLLPGDGADIDDYVDRALNDQAAHREFPMLSHSMHVWYTTPESWAKFEGQLDKYGHNPDWWYCNHNQYAVYRYQFLHTEITESVREGKVLRVRLQRPCLLDLNDPTPLTVRVKNVARRDVADVRCGTAECVGSQRDTGPVLFHVFHDRDTSLPVKVGLISNPRNRLEPAHGDEDPDFPGVRGLLSLHDDGLHLVLRNQTGTSMRNVQVTYRLPLFRNEDAVRRTLGEEIAANAEWNDTVKPTKAVSDYKYTAGTAYYQAQVDFVLGVAVGRLHLDCCVENRTQRDPSYPQGGFSRLGLMPDAEIDLDELANRVQRDGFLKQPWALGDGRSLAWTSTGDSPFDEPYLDPETIRTTGQFNCKESGYYVLQSDVVSERDQTVGLLHSRDTIRRIFLNGSDVTGGPAKLLGGRNRLVVLYHTRFTPQRRFSNYDGEHAGAFLRLVTPRTAERTTDVRFKLPTSE
jgi:peptidoglycan/xylan/chitin deacetylase (PgdA/CDA1 family)